MSGPALVHAATEITPDWMTEVLTGAGVLSGGRVAAVTVEAIGTGQMADTARLTLTYDGDNDGGEAGPASVVGKFASSDEASRATGLALRAYEIEVRFYQEVASRITARVPPMYLAEVEPETGWFTLILGDVAGAVAGDQIAACDATVAAHVLEEMAGLHAPCWEAPDLAARDWLNRNSPDTDALLAAMVGALLPGFLERYGDRLAPEHVHLCERFGAGVGTWSALRAGPYTASHGDFRLDNLLFEPGQQRPVVVDWQTLTWAGGSVDAAYFIGGCLSVEDRRAHEGELLAQYHDALLRGGVRDYPLAQLQRDARRDTFAGLLMAIVASMIVQRTERGDLMFTTSASRHAEHALDSGADALLVARD